MYIKDGTCLRDLEILMYGYGAALHAHEIQNDLNLFNRKFAKFVHEKTQWPTNPGWAIAITVNSDSPESAVETFFDLANDFILSTEGIHQAINETNV